MNRRLLSSICTTALCLALFPTARGYAEENRFYVQGDIGGNVSSDVHLKEFLGQALAPNTQITLDPGARFAIRGGYGLTDWLAAEVETGMLANDIETHHRRRARSCSLVVCAVTERPVMMIVKMISTTFFMT